MELVYLYHGMNNQPTLDVPGVDGYSSIRLVRVGGL